MVNTHSVSLVDYDAERPAYRILATSGFFGPDHTLYEEGSEIYFDGEPSEEMEPLNDAARRKMVAYLEKLEELGRQAAEKAGRPFAGRPRSLDGGLALATAIQRSEMSVLGAKPVQTDIIEKIAADEVPTTGYTKRKQGRPRKVDTLAKTANG